MDRFHWRAGGVLLLALLALGTGCGDDPRLERQREALRLEHEARMAALEQLEIRLLALRSRESQWAELRERHTKVSAIACEQAAAHVAAMEAHDRKQVRKLRERRKVAAAAAVVKRKESSPKRYRQVASQPAAAQN